MIDNSCLASPVLLCLHDLTNPRARLHPPGQEFIIESISVGSPLAPYKAIMPRVGRGLELHVPRLPRPRHAQYHFCQHTLDGEATHDRVNDLDDAGNLFDPFLRLLPRGESLPFSWTRRRTPSYPPCASRMARR